MNSPIISKHIASPVRKAIEQAVLGGNVEALAQAIERLPALVCIPNPILVGSSHGVPAEIQGVWRISHIKDYISTLDQHPRLPRGRHSDGAIAVAADDVDNALGTSAAREYIKNSVPGGKIMDDRANDFWEEDSGSYLSNTTDQITRERVAFGDLHPESVLPEQIVRGAFESAFASNHNGATGNDLVALRNLHAAVNLTRAHAEVFCARHSVPLEKTLSLVSSISAASYLGCYNVNGPASARERFRDFVGEIAEEREGIALNPRAYVRVASVLCSKKVGRCGPIGRDQFAQIEKDLPTRTAQWFNAVEDSDALSVWLSDTENPFGQPGLLHACMVVAGDRFRFPTAHMGAPFFTAKRSHFFAMFMPVGPGQLKGSISFECPIEGDLHAQAADPGNHSHNGDTAMCRAAALIGFHLLFRVGDASRGTFSDSSLRDCWKGLRERYNGFAKHIEPKRLRVAKGFPTPSEIYFRQSMTLRDSARVIEDLDMNDHLGYTATAIALRTGNQIVHVSESLAKVLDLTDFDTDLDILSEPWPFPGITFCFSEGSSAGKSWITLARFDKGDEIEEGCVGPVTHRGPKIRPETSDWVAFGYSEADRNEIRSICPDYHKLGKIAEGCTRAENDDRLKAVLLAFKALVFLMHFPAATGAEHLLRHEKRHGNAVVKEALYSPRVLSIPKTPGTATLRNDLAQSARDARRGTTVTPHWRRGHHRQQPHGPGRTLTKRIFIWPIYVNKPESAADAAA